MAHYITLEMKQARKFNISISILITGDELFELNIFANVHKNSKRFYAHNQGHG